MRNVLTEVLIWLAIVLLAGYVLLIPYVALTIGGGSGGD
jgi:hypothetical protein